MFGAVLEPQLSFVLADAWERARARANVKHEWLAWAMGIPSQQLSHQIAGRGHLSLQRVLMLLTHEDGRTFVRYLAMEVIERSGLDLDALLVIARIERLCGRLIDREQKRVPAKVILEQTNERKRA